MNHQRVKSIREAALDKFKSPIDDAYIINATMTMTRLLLMLLQLVLLLVHDPTWNYVQVA